MTDGLGRALFTAKQGMEYKNGGKNKGWNVWDSELVRQGKEIKYIYDGLNRLVKIDYPFSMDTEYEYGTSAEAKNNAAGRIKSMTDETGTINYTYGDLGQVVEETRTINLLPSDKKEKMSAIMKYKSDYLGRMQEITYPDEEIVTYGYDHGGQITSVKGIRQNEDFVYVKDIGYDEYGQRVYIEYGTGIKTNYTYDPYRRWLKDLNTVNPRNNNKYQDINYSFDAVGNVLGYTNNSYNHTTTQTYKYDDLYQLITAKGESAAHQYVGQTDYTTTYNQNFSFDKIGNMTKKTSTNYVSTDIKIGDNLTYDLNYKYYKGTHKAEIIGDKYYTYDLNGNLVAEREGEHAKDTEAYRSYHKDGEIYYTEYGFGFTKPQGVKTDDGVFQRNYKWNERNLLRESSDSTYTVQYRYGSDGQRAIKYVLNNGRSTLYFNNMWQVSDVTMSFVNSKHIFVGEERIATKYNTRDNENVQEEMHRVYYYHSDHLGSAQTVTNYLGNIHERLEYTPYGELWIDYKDPNQKEDGTPFRFTGKERDLETGLYYYGARYLDPRTSRWMSADPAMSEYIPTPGQDPSKLSGMGGVFNTINMHTYHYAANNPIKYIDPDGRKFKIIDEPYEGSEEKYRSVEENRSIIKENLSIMAGCDINIDKEGFITMGQINKIGADWDAVRTRFSELIDSDKVVGITTNAVGLFSFGWGFNPINDDTELSKRSWASRNGISAYVNISDRVNMEYKNNNPGYKGFWSWFFGGESKYNFIRQNIGGATAHEVLGHARDFALTGRTSEFSALIGENLYHKAAGRPTRDEYR